MGTGYTRNDTSNNIANNNVADAADIDGEFDAIVAAFSSTSGHTHDGTSAEGAPITLTGPSQEYISDVSALFPKTSGVYDLGKVGANWKDLFLSGDLSLGGEASVGSLSVSGALSANGSIEFDLSQVVSSGDLGITDGGTGASNAADARTNLGFTASIGSINKAEVFEQLAGQNLITNSSGIINQRSYASGTPTTEPNQFTLDRWYVTTVGQSLSYSGTSALKTMVAPSGGVSTVIEGLDVLGGEYVISYEGTATCSVNGVVRANGSSFTLAQGIDVLITFSGGTFSKPKLEAGSSPTPFITPQVSNELIKCYRYFVGNLGVTAVLYPPISGDTNLRSIYLPFPVSMRTSNVEVDVSVSNIPSPSFSVDFRGVKIFGITTNNQECGIQGSSFSAEIVAAPPGPPPPPE